IISINRDEDELWTIRMVLVGDEHQESNLIINQMKNEYTEQETSTITG
ncbi:unnamed protein product, partial [Rotaria sp. Silwood2]